MAASSITALILCASSVRLSCSSQYRLQGYLVINDSSRTNGGVYIVVASITDIDYRVTIDVTSWAGFPPGLNNLIMASQ